jgi:hypothetical protein
MPNLVQSLQGRDIGFLRIVARLWGIELTASGINKVSEELARTILDPKNFLEMIDSLPADAQIALEVLVNAKGKLPWVTYARRYGEIREAGPGQRDREQGYLDPISPAEVLFYRALIAKAFFDTPAGAQEHAYIPNDFPNILSQEPHSPVSNSADITERVGPQYHVDITAASAKPSEPLGHPASTRERALQVPASDWLIDDATTLLAALRMGLPLPDTLIPPKVVLDFLSTSKIIPLSYMKDKPTGNTPIFEEARRFLEATRKNALEMLVRAWQESETFNELRQIPGLGFEGDWSNQPLVTRKYLLTLLNAIPENKWWSLSSFIQSLKGKNPDFQRPVGDYDSWFIKRESDGTYLRGFTNWNEVDGALIRYMILGPLFWLGLVDLATPADSDVVSSFRTRIGFPPFPDSQTARLHISSQGKIVVPRLVPRLVRYQIARFCEWDTKKNSEYHYHVSIASLNRAADQGLKVKQLLGILAKNSTSEVPPSFIKALNRWEANGTEARLESHTILKVSRPEVLDELRKSKAGRFLGETLGPVTVTIKSGARPKVLAALAELGLLGEEVGSE